MSWRTYTDFLKRKQFAACDWRPGWGAAVGGCGGWTRSIRRAAVTMAPDLAGWEDRELSAVWIGHATVLLRMGGMTILTDPVFGNRIGSGLVADYAGAEAADRRGHAGGAASEDRSDPDLACALRPSGSAKPRGPEQKDRGGDGPPYARFGVGFGISQRDGTAVGRAGRSSTGWPSLPGKFSTGERGRSSTNIGDTTDICWNRADGACCMAETPPIRNGSKMSGR